MCNKKTRVILLHFLYVCYLSAASNGKRANLPRGGSSFKQGGVGQPALGIWAEYANLPHPAVGWQASRLVCRKNRK